MSKKGIWLLSLTIEVLARELGDRLYGCPFELFGWEKCNPDSMSPFNSSNPHTCKKLRWKCWRNYALSKASKTPI